jgi:hypothetical protein
MVCAAAGLAAKYAATDERSLSARRSLAHGREPEGEDEEEGIATAALRRLQAAAAGRGSARMTAAALSGRCVVAVQCSAVQWGGCQARCPA